MFWNPDGAALQRVTDPAQESFLCSLHDHRCAADSSAVQSHSCVPAFARTTRSTSVELAGQIALRSGRAGKLDRHHTVWFCVQSDCRPQASLTILRKSQPGGEAVAFGPECSRNCEKLRPLCRA